MVDISLWRLSLGLNESETCVRINFSNAALIYNLDRNKRLLNEFVYKREF